MLNSVSKFARKTSQLNHLYFPGKHVQEQVMTTAQWPVPFYNRRIKAYPVRGRVTRKQAVQVQHAG